MRARKARGAMQGPITHLLNARRQLDLTPRQVAQLDSLERIQYAEHEQFDARMEAERPQLDQRRRRDSSMSAAAERILNDSQRQRAREMQAERRGYERGVRESRAPSHCVKRTPLTPSLSPSVSLTKEPP